MTCTYETQITATCPRDHSLTDIYDLIVRSEEMIAVEAILGAVEKYTDAPIYQEALAEHLAEWLDADVTLVGLHSGVRTTVTA